MEGRATGEAENELGKVVVRRIPSDQVDSGNSIFVNTTGNSDIVPTKSYTVFNVTWNPGRREFHYTYQKGGLRQIGKLREGDHLPTGLVVFELGEKDVEIRDRITAMIAAGPHNLRIKEFMLDRKDKGKGKA